ncbi:MAG: hypothetical protein JRJ65_14030 [Deltaproteobacteria bacterium]|nr:hypothetical protein [Deltaproteobacteria bacterium]
MAADEITSLVKICEKCGALEIEKVDNPEDKIVEVDGKWFCRKCIPEKDDDQAS